MGLTLQRRLRQSRFQGTHHEAILNLMVVAAHLRSIFDRVCAEHDITDAQYNVLRILRGAHPDGYPRGEIAQRMMDRAPDVTRLIDRLELRGLVERERSGSDRRLSITRITPQGLALLERLDPGIRAVDDELGRRLSEDEARELSRICERIYDSEPTDLTPSG